jgi:hypothetical protein
LRFELLSVDWSSGCVCIKRLHIAAIFRKKKILFDTMKKGFNFQAFKWRLVILVLRECYSHLSTTFALKFWTSKVSKSTRLYNFLPSVSSVHELQAAAVQIRFLSAQIRTRKYLLHSLSAFPRELDLVSRISSQSKGQNKIEPITRTTIILCTSKWTWCKNIYALRYIFWLVAESATGSLLTTPSSHPSFCATLCNRV